MDGIKRLAEVYRENDTKALENRKHTETQVAAIQMQETIVKSFESLVRYLDNRVSKTTVVNQLKEIGTPDALKVAEAVDSLHETLKTHKNTDLTEVTKVLSELLSEAKKIPKELPEQKEQKFVDYTKQFTSLQSAIQSLEKVVKAQELIAEAPIVNVPETNVNVEAPDLQPLQESIKDVVGAVKKIIIPEYKTDNKEVEKLIKASNKLLKQLLDKPVSSGGGGGSSWIATDSSGIPIPIQLESDGSVPVTVVAGGSGGGLTDAELRATPVPVSGTVTANLGTLNGAATAANQQTDALTDTELRATPVPVSGTVTATPTGTQNVDVTANTIGLATAANQLPDGHNVTVDNGIGAAAVPIQDGGNSITVDGTVAATQSGTWTEANSAAIKTAVETIDNAISGSEMQVDVVGALPAGTNAIGKLAANSGVDIGDVDVTSSVSSTLDHGSNLDIDTTAEQITSTSFAAKFGVTVKSAVDNTATVYIGNSDVTDGDTAATDGFPLEPGESITLPVTNSNLLYAIAASANQKVFWIGV